MHRTATCAAIALWWGKDAIAIAIVGCGRVLGLVITGVIELLLDDVVASERFANDIGTGQRILNAPHIPERHVERAIPVAERFSERVVGGVVTGRPNQGGMPTPQARSRRVGVAGWLWAANVQQVSKAMAAG